MQEMAAWVERELGALKAHRERLEQRVASLERTRDAALQDGSCCSATEGGWSCTLPLGHDGNHEAHTTFERLPAHTWPQELVAPKGGPCLTCRHRWVEAMAHLDTCERVYWQSRWMSDRVLCSTLGGGCWAWAPKSGVDAGRSQA